MFSLVSLSKSKFLTSVALLSFVEHSCHTRVVRVALVLHLCRTCVTRVSLVLVSCFSCCTRVVCVALVSLVSGTRVIKQTRSKSLKRYTSLPVVSFSSRELQELFPSCAHLVHSTGGEVSIWEESFFSSATKFAHDIEKLNHFHRIFAKASACDFLSISTSCCFGTFLLHF